MKSGIAIDSFLSQVEARIKNIAPELTELFKTFSGEAKFGRGFIDDNLKKLQPGAEILEVGAGAMLLSCQLMREGFRVTALEPLAEGFDHFQQLQELVLSVARDNDCMPHIMYQSAESLSAADAFDFAFSINVMEHVENVSAVLANVTRSLRRGATYHFTCPNYRFPYEPHFNLPTLFDKRLTETVLHKKIFGHPTVPDPIGTWRSLNWITVSQIRKTARQMGNVVLRFNRRLFFAALERMVNDEVFSSRRSPWMRTIIKTIVALRLHHLALGVPVRVQPLIDCSVVRVF